MFRFALPFLALIFVAACSAPEEETSSRVVAKIPAKSLVDLKTIVTEHRPQIIFEGRGYTYTAHISDPSRGFDTVRLNLANTEVRSAATQYCKLSRTKVSRFFNFSTASDGVETYTMYFNCE